MSLEIKVDAPQGSRCLVSLHGRLDTHSFEQLDHALGPVLASHPDALVLDLSALDYISSAGIRSIFKARKSLASHGGKLLVTNLQPQIQKVFDIVKAVPMDSVFSSMAEADSYLDTMQRKVLEGNVEDDEYS